MSSYQNTFAMLDERERAYERQLRLIRHMRQALMLGKDLIFEVHFQQDGPNVTAIMAENKDFAAALTEAVRLWNAYNRPNKDPRPLQDFSPELFVRFGETRIAINSQDATVLGVQAFDSGAAPIFHLDQRVGRDLSTIIFEKGDRLPSCWYADLPTVKPEATARIA